MFRRRSHTMLLTFLALMLLLPVGVAQAQQSSQPIDFDLRTWSQEGVPDWGNWDVSSDGQQVVQTINDSPTFFVSPETFTSATIDGTIKVQTGSDDDFIGFVFGYRGPRSPNRTSYDLYAFNWKQSTQTFGGCEAQEGMSVIRVRGEEDPNADYTPGGTSHPAFWCESQAEADARGYSMTVDVLDTRFGDGMGWDDDTAYDFTLDYQPDRVTISIDGQQVFDIPGTFPEGAFGFYNYSQSDVLYTGFTVEDSSPQDQPQRLSGVDRYATAVKLSQATFSPGVPAVYIATGTTFPDALAGGVPAAIEDAPALLVGRDVIPQVVTDELQRLAPQRIVILGGTAAVSQSVEQQLAGYTSGPVERLAGPDRYATAAAISRDTFPNGAGTVLVASGRTFPDALSGVPAAATWNGPILLVEPDVTPDATWDELQRLAPNEIVILGGPSAVSDRVEAEIDGIAPTRRLQGPDRFATSAAISADAFPNGASTVYVATGFVFADALSAGAVAGATPGPVILTAADDLPDVQHQEVARLNPDRIVILGGRSAVSDAVAQELADIMSR